LNFTIEVRSDTLNHSNEFLLPFRTQSTSRSRSRSRGRSPARTAKATPAESTRKSTPAARTPAVATRASERVAAKAGVAQKESPKINLYWTLILLFIASSPLLLVSLHSTCSKKACKVEWPLNNLPKNASAYFDQQALVLVASFVVGLELLSLVPIGSEIQTPSGEKARSTGAIFLVLGLSGALGLHFKGVDVSVVSDKYFLIMTSTILATFVISLFAYVLARLRGSGDNPKGNTGNLVLDFFYGKELDPTFLKLDFKLLVRRVSLTGLALLNVLLLLASIRKKEPYNQGAAVAVTLQV